MDPTPSHGVYREDLLEMILEREAKEARKEELRRRLGRIEGK